MGTRPSPSHPHGPLGVGFSLNQGLSFVRCCGIIGVEKEISDEQAARKAEEAARKAEDAAAEDAPTGRQQITGKVLATKWQDNDFGGVHKMLVRDASGWKGWVSVPSSIDPGKGDIVTLVATWTPSHDDPKFAFGKRPSKASVVERASN